MYCTSITYYYCHAYHNEGMTTFYFVLGMVVVLVIAGVIAMFTVIKTINSLKEQTKNYDIQFYDIHRKIDDENREQKRDSRKISSASPFFNISFSKTVE